MSRKTKRPELRIRREFMNMKPAVDAFAEAYRIYFKERSCMKASERTFDTGEAAGYNDPTSGEEV